MNQGGGIRKPLYGEAYHHFLTEGAEALERDENDTAARTMYNIHNKPAYQTADIISSFTNPLYWDKEALVERNGYYASKMNGEPYVALKGAPTTAPEEGYRWSFDPTGKNIQSPISRDDSKHAKWLSDNTLIKEQNNQIYKSGKGKYNGKTYLEALAMLKEMREALKKGFKPTRDWGSDDGYFGKNTAAAWKEYLAWKNNSSNSSNSSNFRTPTQNSRYTEDGYQEVLNSDGTWVDPQDSDNPMLAALYAPNNVSVADERLEFVMNTARNVLNLQRLLGEYHPTGATKTDADGRYYVWIGGRWSEVKDD